MSLFILLIALIYIPDPSNAEAQNIAVTYEGTVVKLSSKSNLKHIPGIPEGYEPVEGQTVAVMYYRTPKTPKIISPITEADSDKHGKFTITVKPHMLGHFKPKDKHFEALPILKDPANPEDIRIVNMSIKLGDTESQSPQSPAPHD
ncbi:hypothetical protein Ddc_10715 [Ditylenchus destructor]|nr:hypothetical protein Ddc_10715 [Ditylenchus destructor]